jgi:DNA-binding NarL/FixJ family response regulator
MEGGQMKPRILIADDHEIVLEGIRTLLARSRRDWEICGEARNGEDAMTLVQEVRPDVVVLDITMPRVSGLQAAMKISKLNTGCRILIFTMHDSPRLAAEVRNAGAHGFVLKSQAARDLVRAIECLLGGDTFFGAEPKEKSKDNPGRSSGPMFRWAYAEF